MPYWINAGIYIFDRRIEEELPQLGDHEDRTFPRLAREGKMAALKSRAFWRGVDSCKDLQEAEEYLSLRSPGPHPSTPRRPDAFPGAHDY